MIHNAKMLDEIYEHLVSKIERDFHTENYAELSEALVFLLKYNKWKHPEEQSHFYCRELEKLIEHCKKKKSHGFLRGTMGAVYLLTKASEVTNETRFLREASLISNSFLEYLSNDIGLNNGISGTLLGYLHLHSVTKEDWVLEDINIYLNYLIDRIIISKHGFFFDSAEPKKFALTSELNVCFVLLKLSKYLNNKALLRVAIELYNNETKKYSALRDFSDSNVLWENWYFAFGVTSMMLFESLNEKKYLINFNNTSSFLDQGNNSAENLIHLTYFLGLKAKNKGLGHYYKKAISKIEKHIAWEKYPLIVGSLLLSHQSNSFDQLNLFDPLIKGKLTPREKAFPLFKNILGMREYDMSQRILENNATVT